VELARVKPLNHGRRIFVEKAFIVFILVVAFKQETEQCIQILTQNTNNNPVLIGYIVRISFGFFCKRILSFLNSMMGKKLLFNV
jgi:hypothetical protein